MANKDTETQIYFYENNYYIFSNFSAFAIEWKGRLYQTSEHVYQTEKFEDEKLREEVRTARSAHDAKLLSRKYQDQCREDWDAVKVAVMKEILRAKIEQHPYVKKKLLDSGQKEIIEDSHRDNFWGWGPNQDGTNQLGKLWMELREEYRD